MLFISSTIIHMRATQHFHRGILLGTTRIKRKEIQRNTLKYFGAFGFLEQGNKREKQKREKLFTRESSQQAKRRTRKSFWILFLVLLLSMHRK